MVDVACLTPGMLEDDLTVPPVMPLFDLHPIIQRNTEPGRWHLREDTLDPVLDREEYRDPVGGTGRGNYPDRVLVVNDLLRGSTCLDPRPGQVIYQLFRDGEGKCRARHGEEQGEGQQ